MKKLTKMTKNYLLLLLIFPLLCYSQYNDSAPWLEENANTNKTSTSKEKSINELRTLLMTIGKITIKQKREAATNLLCVGILIGVITKMKKGF